MNSVDSDRRHVDHKAEHLVDSKWRRAAEPCPVELEHADYRNSAGAGEQVHNEVVVEVLRIVRSLVVVGYMAGHAVVVVVVGGYMVGVGGRLAAGLGYIQLAVVGDTLAVEPQQVVKLVCQTVSFVHARPLLVS